MKNKFQLLYNIIIGIALISLFFLFNKGSEKIGYLDFDIFLNKYEGIKPLEKKFRTESKLFQDNIDTLTFELNRDIKTFEEKQNGMSTKELNFKRDELAKKKNDLIRYQEAITSKMKEEQERIINSISKDVRDYLADYSKKNNYKIIFIKNERTIAYGDGGADITNEIILGLNEKFKKRE